jgi:hypothetical protein
MGRRILAPRPTVLPPNRCSNCTHPDLRTPKTFPPGHQIRHYLRFNVFRLATVLGPAENGGLEVKHHDGSIWWADSRHCTELDNPPLAADYPYGRHRG